MVIRVCVLCGTPGISQQAGTPAHPGRRGGLKFRCKGTTFFGRLSVMYYQKLRAGVFLAPTGRDVPGQARWVLKFRCKGTTFFCRLLGKYAQKRTLPAPPLKGGKPKSPFKTPSVSPLKGENSSLPLREGQGGSFLGRTCPTTCQKM